MKIKIGEVKYKVEIVDKGEPNTHSRNGEAKKAQKQKRYTASIHISKPWHDRMATGPTSEAAAAELAKKLGGEMV
jgi:hypothetical protein